MSYGSNRDLSETRNLLTRRQVDRRSVLGGLLGAAGVGLGLGGASAQTSTPTAVKEVKVTLPTRGSAGSVWRPAIPKLNQSLLSGLNINWVGGDPGQMQVQLTAGALDVGVFGAVGLATANARGADIVLFGPALNNHGRWIVRNDSPYQKPADLKGKKIATQPRTTETYNQARIAASLIGLDLNSDFEVIFGPPTANLALFERGDVEGVIVLEPTASRLIGAGAREIARVGDMWQEATGDRSDPFLVGLAAQRSWLEANRATASQLARVFSAANGELRKNPQLFVEFHKEIGLRENEHAAIASLPKRLPDVYPVAWDQSVWKVIDRQIEVAIKVGALAAKPEKPLYDGVPLVQT